MMGTVELIYDHDCPNVEMTRTRLLQAFAEVGVSARWEEWERGDNSSPPHFRAYGSPTILVNGKDVAGVHPSENIDCCRLYTYANRSLNGALSVEMIAAALRNTADGLAPKSVENKPVGWRSSLAVLPGIGASLLPVGVCPACWPAYAGLLSSLGLGFLLESAYLLPVIALFLVMAVATLAYKARTRRGYKPFILGLVASSIVLVGKFILGSEIAMYGGIAVLITASLWNAWPRKKVGTGKGTCPACASSGTDVVIDANGGTNENKEVLP